MDHPTKGKQSAKKGFNNKVVEAVSLEYQQEHKIKYQRRRPIVRLIAHIQIIFGCLCLLILTGSLFAGSFFSIEVVNNDDNWTEERQEESWTLAIIRFVWFSVPAFYVETCLALWASCRLLKATDKGAISFPSLEGIRFWLRVNSALAMINVAGVFLILREYQPLYILGHCFILGRLFFLVQVYQFRAYFELMLLLTTKDDFAATLADMMQQLQLERMMAELAAAAEK